jgi:hypothetical protein
MRNSDSRRVRDLVYETFVSQGRAPSIGELARLTGKSVLDVNATLGELADAHALVLSDDGDSIRMAHPFTAAPMAFVVTPRDGADDRRWWGGCAWDSFGISAALDLDVRIDTACPYCSAHISVVSGPQIAPDPNLAVRFPRPAAEWWDDVVGTCTMIRMFCNPGHAERWTAEHAPSSGYVTDAVTVWRLALPWYGDRVDPEFLPHTREVNQGLLDAVGLIGPFWRLP